LPLKFWVAAIFIQGNGGIGAARLWIYQRAVPTLFLANNRTDKVKFNNGITAKQLRKLLSYNKDTGQFTWLVSPRHSVAAGDIAGHLKSSDGLIAIGIAQKRYMAQRLAWLWCTGKFPDGVIHHLNGIKHDNRISNLRETIRYRLARAA
jgi:hypothetical protein